MGRPPRSATALYRELVATSEAMVSRLRDGDETGLASAMDERDALLAAIGITPVQPSETPDIAAAIGRVLAYDESLRKLLEAQKAQVGDELAKVAESRAALQSYRGAPPRSAAYVERLG